MYRIVYVSDAVRPMTDEDLAAILEPARRANAEAHVTGLLVHAQGLFLQVLEGPEQAVEQAYARALASRRHTRLRRTPALREDRRRFSEWAMGFERAAPTHVVTHLLEPLVQAGHVSHAEARGVLLERFSALQAAAR